MTPSGSLNGLPIACRLTVGASREQLERWRAFDTTGVRVEAASKTSDGGGSEAS